LDAAARGMMAFCVAVRMCAAGGGKSAANAVDVRERRAGFAARALAGARNVAAAAVLAASAAWLATDAAAAATITAPGDCVMGEGDACAELAGDNPLIRKLQERSLANKEATLKKQLDEWYLRGYGDYFKVGYDKELVHLENGEWELRDPESILQRAARRLTGPAPQSK